MPGLPLTPSNCSAKVSVSPCICAALGGAVTPPFPTTCRGRIGPSTPKLAALILEPRPHPEQGYRPCLGILRLARQYGADRLEAACDRGLDIGARSYGSIPTIPQDGLA